MRVFLESGAAAGGVGDDGVERLAEECRHILAGEFASDVAFTGVGGKCAAAKLICGDDYFAAIGLQDANGGVVEFGESDLRDASGEKCDAGAARAFCGKSLSQAREEKVGIDAGEKSGALLKSEEAKDAGAARESFEAGALIKANEAGDAGDAARIGKQAFENVAASEARKARALEIAGDLGASEFDELAVFDSRGAGGLAGAAIEAAVNVGDECVAEFEAALIDEGHLADASARGIGFIVPEAIGGAGVEAQAAVDAAGIVGVVGLVTGGEAAERFGEFALSFFVGKWRGGGHFFRDAPKYCYARRGGKVQKNEMAV